MKIVIIEDEKDLGILIHNFLAKQLDTNTSDSIIKVATTISEGLEFIYELSPDWVFVDNNLPDGKGIDEIETIKKQNRSVPTGVVMMSAMTNLKEEALRKGADYFLAKPISFVEINRIIGKPF
jgi:two-component system KDP operon response regulator KdpE